MQQLLATMAIVVAWTVVLGGVAAHGQDIDITVYRPQVSGTVWKSELGATGDWFDEALWTEGVPDATTTTFLVIGSETLLDKGAAEASSLSLSNPSYRRSRLTQTGGELNVDQSVSITDGIYRLVGGRLAARSLDVGQLWTLFLLPDLTDVPKPEISCHDNSDGLCLPDLVLLATEKRFCLRVARWTSPTKFELVRDT